MSFNVAPFGFLQRRAKIPPAENLVTLPSVLTFNPRAWDASNAEERFPDMKIAYENSEVLQSREGCDTFPKWFNSEAACYPYALGDQSLLLNRLTSYSSIGVMSGVYFDEEKLTEEKIIKAVECDGLKPTGDEIKIEPGFRPVILYMNERDCHWVRLDRPGLFVAGEPRIIYSQKWSDRPPQILRHMDNRKIDDPRTISIVQGYSKVVRNPTRSPSEGFYNFVSFVNVPDDLSISVDVINAHKAVIKKLNSDLADDWDAHLQRMNIPTSGKLLISQYG